MNHPLPAELAAASGQWCASIALDLQRRRGGTRLVGCRHEGPLYVQRPFYPEGPDCAHVYLLHPPGGMVSGDSLEVDIRLGAQARALLTTPGAARAYRARRCGTRQYQRTSLHLERQAGVEWFPLDTIVYDGAEVSIETRVHLAGGAHCALWEVTCLGLPASGAPFRSGSCRQRYRVYHDGVPVFVDGFDLNDDNRKRMAGAAGLQAQPVYGFFLFGPVAADNGAEVLAQLREAVAADVAHQFSITRLGDYYVGRYLGDSAERARAQFSRWWQLLRPALCGRPACPPRIWLT